MNLPAEKELMSKQPVKVTFYTSFTILIIVSINLSRIRTVRLVDAVSLIAFGMVLSAFLFSTILLWVIKRRSPQ